MKKINILIYLFISTNIFAQYVNDESYKDKSFMDFKFQLETAVHTKDQKMLAGLLHDTIYESNDICGYPGCVKSEFFQYHFQDKNSEEWIQIEEIMRFGFVKKDPDQAIVQVNGIQKLFVAPSYIYKISGDTSVLALGENINIRDQPNKKGKVLAQVSWEVLSCKCIAYLGEQDTYVWDEDENAWLKVTYNGITGYIFHKFTSDSYNTFLSVAYIKGKWKIISWYTPPGC